MGGRDGLELSLAEMGARCDGSRAALVEAEEVRSIDRLMDRYIARYIPNPTNPINHTDSYQTL